VSTTVAFGDFEWDADKAASNADKHDVTFHEAATVLTDPLAIEFQDAAEAGRIHTVGSSAAARTLLVVTVERGVRIRIISARKATRAERRRYEER